MVVNSTIQVSRRGKTSIYIRSECCSAIVIQFYVISILQMRNLIREKIFPSLIIQFLKISQTKIFPGAPTTPLRSPVISLNIKISLKSKYFFQTPPLLTPLEHIAIRQG